VSDVLETMLVKAGNYGSIGGDSLSWTLESSRYGGIDGKTHYKEAFQLY
jgi:hypothetical protein